MPPLCRLGLILAALVTLRAASSRIQTPAADPRPPNVLLIVTDDQGYGDLGIHGNTKIRTPNLDRLGRDGIRLTQFYVSPVCAPTRASLMTGRYNYRTGVVDTYLGRALMAPDEVTLAEMLAAAGYRTGIFGKWHLGDNHPLRAMDQGFRECLVHTGGGIGQPSDPPGNTYFDPILQHNGKPERRRGYCTDIFTDAAIRFIERNRKHRFFAYLATNAPHEPLQIADSWVQPYRAMGLDETTAKVYGMVENIDWNAGRLVERLEALGLAERTLVIYLTDNGPQQARYTSGLRGRKGSVYEGGIHVPCFIRWPGGLAGGRTVDRITAHIDLAPTILDACHAPPPVDVRFDGRSLMPLLRGDSASWPARTLYFQWHRGDVPVLYRSCAARADRYKLVDGKELYDLTVDSGETRDVAAEHPETVRELRSGCEAWFRDVSSTRGYDPEATRIEAGPPRIYLGTRHEDPVTLTRQDWRGTRAGWAADSLGYWEVDVRRAGAYRITFRFPPLTGPAEARFRLGTVEVRRSLEHGATSCRFRSLHLDSGPARLEAWLERDGTSMGVHYVDVSHRAE